MTVARAAIAAPATISITIWIAAIIATVHGWDTLNNRIVVQALAMFAIIARRERAANILDKINARGIERRQFQKMMHS